MYGLDGKDFDEVGVYLETTSREAVREIPVLQTFLVGNSRMAKIFQILNAVGKLVKDIKDIVIDENGKFIKLRWYHFSRILKAVRIIAKFVHEVKIIIRR